MDDAELITFPLETDMRILPSLMALMLSGALTVPALAAEMIEVVHPWARPTIPNRPGVAYLGIHNHAGHVEQLVSAHAEGIEKIELHLAEQVDGVMKMAPVDIIEIPAEGMVHLGPGGYHLMLFGLDKPLKMGDEITLTLVFETAGEIAVTVPVTKKVGDADGHGSHQHGSGDHGQGSHNHGQNN